MVGGCVVGGAVVGGSVVGGSVVGGRVVGGPVVPGPPVVSVVPLPGLVVPRCPGVRPGTPDGDHLAVDHRRAGWQWDHHDLAGVRVDDARRRRGGPDDRAGPAERHRTVGWLGGMVVEAPLSPVWADGAASSTESSPPWFTHVKPMATAKITAARRVSPTEP